MSRTTLAIVTALLVSGSGAFAHHSHLDFALDRNATVTGTVESVRFQNPHVLILVRTSGSTFYTAEWQGAGWLQSHPELVSPTAAPVTSDTLKPGDRIIVVGAPPRDSALRSIVNLKEVRRPRDGWRWSCQQPSGQSAC
jgi:hypothetical protein